MLGRPVAPRWFIHTLKLLGFGVANVPVNVGFFFSGLLVADGLQYLITLPSVLASWFSHSPCTTGMMINWDVIIIMPALPHVMRSYLTTLPSFVALNVCMLLPVVPNMADAVSTLLKLIKSFISHLGLLSPRAVLRRLRVVLLLRLLLPHA